ncbi:MAG TPA: riboflavin synthase [Vicinamibacterales bacterium]|nr:riboflavin synthase [Vicinamibacterales bacterium]
MFTGIIEQVGRLAEVKPMAGGYRVRIATPLADETRPGDSVAVSGVCLTALVVSQGEIHADIGPETGRVTTLGALARGQRVNLERSMRFDGRIGGHFVLGHVDGMGVVEDVRPEGDSHWLTVSYPPSLAPLFIRKGSVTVDGVSLTVAGLDDRRIDLQIIPYTWDHTTLSNLKSGDKVNLECDVLGKYVIRAAEIAGISDLRRR